MSMSYNKLPKDEPFKYVKLANPKLEQHETLLNGMPNYNIKYNVNVKAVVNNFADKTIYDAIIKYATEQGITDLFLIDEKFVKSALLNEIQRRENQTQLDALKRQYSELLKEYKKLVALLSKEAYENAEKEAKENGFVRVKIDNLPKLPRTNFDKITESVESFVKWIYSQYGGSPPDMPCKETSCENPNCKECFKEWLQKECEE